METIRACGLELRAAKLLSGLDPGEVDAARASARAAREGFQEIERTGRARGLAEPCLWPRLPFVKAGEPNSPDALSGIEAWAKAARKKDLVVSFGIGGSYLGNRVLRDALLGPLWNELSRKERGDRPELRFAGYHLDPLEARALVELIASKARGRKGKLGVEVLAISKSGGTTETLAGVLAFLQALGRTKGVEASFTALTDPGSVLAELSRAREGGLLPFPQGIGGRWSVLSTSGLVTAAASGVSVRALLKGAAEMALALRAGEGDPAKDPALLYALLHHLHAKRGRTLAVFMPYSDRLKCVSEWYVQLLAESLGKKLDRRGKTVNAGRTPIVAVGTTDMHAQTQLHQEGPRDKVVTTLDVASWGKTTAADRVPGGFEHAQAKKLRGKTFADLNTLAREANEEALFRDVRPSCSIVLDRLDERVLGGLLYFLMASVAYEGELLDVCAYDQPGVEAYKAIMRERL